MDTVSARILKPSKRFKPCPADTGDELYPNGIFEYNISRLLAHIANHPGSFERESISVQSLRHFAHINEAHIGTVDITKPILLAEIAPGNYNVIDGNHRLEMAKRLGIGEIPAYKFGPEVHINFLTSEKSYLAYIKYWNGKINAENKHRKKWKDSY